MGRRAFSTSNSGGGTVIAQDEASSQVFSMPRAAIATGAVDYVLSLAQIAPALIATVAALTPASTPTA
jgi:two-component system, chemotaxis family, protein-glutamate methylesterase/glutaminase